MSSGKKQKKVKDERFCLSSDLCTYYPECLIKLSVRTGCERIIIESNLYIGMNTFAFNSFLVSIRMLDRSNVAGNIFDCERTRIENILIY